MQSDSSWLKEANMTGHPFWFNVFFCGFKLSPLFMLTTILTSLRVWPVYVFTFTCIRASVCTWPSTQLVCVIALSPSLSHPVLYHTLPPHCSASRPGWGVWSCSSQEVVHCIEGKANNEMHKHRKCYFPPSASS